MTFKISLLSLTFLVLIGKVKGQYCTKDTRYTEVSFFDSSEITIAKDVQYGAALNNNNETEILLMDLYYPNLNIDKSLKRPFVMLAHGGGFVSGDKSSGDIVDLCYHLARRGFVCASIKYRLGHNGAEYQQLKAKYRALQDNHAALRFVVNNANTVRIDTSWMFIGGQSAGAITALGVVYTKQQEFDSLSLLYGNTAISNELGSLYTSGNILTNTYSIKGIFNNWGGSLENDVDLNEMLPTIAFHGEKDSTVFIDYNRSIANYTLIGSRVLHNKLVANNICSELTVDTNGEHGIFRNASSLFRAQRASCFFKSIFCGNCTSLYTTDSVFSKCSATLSAAKINSNPSIDVFPNPVGNLLQIKGVNEAMEISISNFVGQQVYTTKTSQGEVRIDLQPGIYYLQINLLESNQSFTKKLVRN